MRKILFTIISISILFTACKRQEGCTYPNAINYDSSVENDDGSCIYSEDLKEIDCSYTLGTLTDTSVSSYVAPNDSVITESGIYQVIIHNVAGCDSIITIDLTIVPPTAIGDYRDGGVVFWLDGDGGGMVCAIENQSDGIRWDNGFERWTGAGGSAVGKGDENTTIIIGSLGPVETNYAAGLARAYNGGGNSDWFLPSRFELTEMKKNETIINGVSSANGGSVLDNVYWSSTEYNTDYAYYFVFPAGSAFTNAKTSTIPVRAVRRFYGF